MSRRLVVRPVDQWSDNGNHCSGSCVKPPDLKHLQKSDPARLDQEFCAAALVFSAAVRVRFDGDLRSLVIEWFGFTGARGSSSGGYSHMLLIGCTQNNHINLFLSVFYQIWDISE